MSRSQPRNIAASVRQQLLNLAQARGQAFDLILTRYCLERLLYRIGVSDFRDKFLLKGAMLHSLWYESPFRATRDLDLLGSGAAEIDAVVETFRTICTLPAEDDGVVFEPSSVTGSDIRAEEEYQGVRVRLVVRLAGAKISLQVDVGFGDVVTPAPDNITYPTLLNFPAPKLKAYSKYTVVAEKFHAMVRLGLGNSRMKDFFDLWVMCRAMTFEGAVLAKALAATFERRRTPLPADAPPALKVEFGREAVKRTQWAAFLRKNELVDEMEELTRVVELLDIFLMAPALAAGKGQSFKRLWPPGGPWAEKERGSD